MTSILKHKSNKSEVKTELQQNDKLLIYLFFSSSFLCFSIAVFCSTDPRLELEDL
jgi:hypothetical protein